MARRPQDRRGHALDIVKNIVVAESQDRESLTPQRLLSQTVRLGTAVMARSIDFDDQPRRLAVEIDHKMADGMLTPELQAGQPFTAKDGPELALRHGGFLAILSSPADEGGRSVPA